MKIKRNDGIGESNIIQNRFTAYLTIAIRRKRNSYLIQHSKQKKLEISLDEGGELELFFTDTSVNTNTDKKDLSNGFENDQLGQAIEKLKERDRIILFKRAIDQKSFVEIAEELNINYVTVKASFRRTLEKLRKELEKNDF